MKAILTLVMAAFLTAGCGDSESRTPTQASTERDRDSESPSRSEEEEEEELNEKPPDCGPGRKWNENTGLCSGRPQDKGPKDKSQTVVKHDESSLACDHFRNVASDAANGLLTDAELRGKLKEIHGNASIATPAVRSAARQMLAAMTNGGYGALASSVTEMDEACTATGN